MNTLTQQSRRLANNISWLLFQEVLIRIIGLATAIYLARVLSPAGYGALGLALAIVGILSTLVQAGTGSRATRLTALGPETVPQTYAQITGIRLVVAVALIGSLILFAPALSRAFSISDYLLILYSFLLLRAALIVIWAFRGLDQMHINAIAVISEKTIVFVGLILLVKGQGNDLLWVPALEVLAALAMVWWLRKRLVGIYPGLVVQFRFRDWSETLRESIPLGLAALMGSVYLHGAILLLGWLDTAESAADFLVAQKLMLTMAVLLHVISKSAFPSASRLLSTDVPAALELISSLLRYYLVIITPVILLLAHYSGETLALLFGSEYSSSGVVLIVLLAALPFLAISHSLQMLLRAIPKPRAVLAGRVLITVVLLMLAALLIPHWGARGAAAALVASEAAGMLLLFYLVNLALGAVPWNIRCAGPILAGAIASLVFSVTAQWPVYFSLPLAATVYGVVVLMTKSISTDELRSLPSLLSAGFSKVAPEHKP